MFAAVHKVGRAPSAVAPHLEGEGIGQAIVQEAFKGVLLARSAVAETGGHKVYGLLVGDQGLEGDGVVAVALTALEREGRDGGHEKCCGETEMHGGVALKCRCHALYSGKVREEP